MEKKKKSAYFDERKEEKVQKEERLQVYVVAGVWK